MAKRPRHDAKRGEELRKVLLGAGLVVSVGSLALYLHGVSDGAPAFLESLRPRAAEADPLSVSWFPALAGLLLVFGAMTRLRFAWVALAGLAIFGTFFFTQIGWVYLLVAALLAALAGQIPPRPRTPVKKGI